VLDSETQVSTQNSFTGQTEM